MPLTPDACDHPSNRITPYPADIRYGICRLCGGQVNLVGRFNVGDVVHISADAAYRVSCQHARRGVIEAVLRRCRGERRYAVVVKSRHTPTGLRLVSIAESDLSHATMEVTP